MSYTEAKEFLRKYNLEENIITFQESTATVTLAAQAIGCSDDEIAKSMAFKTNNGNILILSKGTARIDNRKFKDYFKCKAKMLTSEELIEYIGHPPGGVCPFGVKNDVTIYLDASLSNFDIVYPAAGTANSAVKITVNELEKVTNSTWIDVCK